MLLIELLDRAGREGAVVVLKIDGQRDRRRWTVVVSHAEPELAHRGDFERVDQAVDHLRTWLAQLPGDWSWLDEPVEDLDLLG
ncbi:hypothetical protein [Lentzea flava]|uniref:Uncharacterized protein n=1 Tax=Lentzea flava TaxID=103732 RepID=A0ABQ2VGM8_9PSEU|nr:hypothetical protein [Lentzea flava]MCP2204956.1 hypothetical protein [Lentzea flava]GGU82478.1 hypothetical protein GCM10010178_86210 [Lentzea flava]